ncbi:MAG: hypothetical protein WCL26_06995 [Actinomycetes bacterium]
MDKEVYKSGASGEKMPKGVLASDESGERRGKVVGGVGMGKQDAHMNKELKGGSKEAVCYTHNRSSYQ